ncbi:MAG: sugar ABC transporter permease [Desulfurococcales archaeon]|nr:sugar ABC transporter permease [Desulfurococcales archaeon]
MPRESRDGIFFVLPSLIVLFVLTVYPLAYTLYLSFHEYGRKTSFQAVFVGLENFAEALGDDLFRTAFINTLVFVAGATSLELLVGLGLALLLSSNVRAKRYLVGIILVPMMLPTVVISSFWRIMYHTELGVINAILGAIGLGPVNWLGNPDTAMLSLILVDVWQYSPFSFIVFYAAINSIPVHLIESAKVDGASSYQIFRHIILPSIKKYILIVAMLRIIDTFRIFDKVFALTGGGPGNSTETLSFVIYKEAFRYYNFGYSSAEAVIMLLAVLLIIAAYIRAIVR